MTATTLETQTWTGRRWLATILVVMSGQIILIFWLSLHQPMIVHPAINEPEVFLANDDIMERLALSNPAQFALANRNGFSGGAWLQTPALEYDSPEWTEPPRPLLLSVEKLGSALKERAQSDLAGIFETASVPEPQLEPIAPLPDLPARSTLVVEGELARRPLLSVFKLESWPAGDILSNTVVQIGVDQDGTVFSAVLPDGPKDSKEGKAVDAYALNLARTAHFQPLPRTDFDRPDRSDSGLQWGRLVFHWRTIPLLATNSTVANP
jgi:hypothetical protein